MMTAPPAPSRGVEPPLLNVAEEDLCNAGGASSSDESVYEGARQWTNLHRRILLTLVSIGAMLVVSTLAVLVVQKPPVRSRKIPSHIFKKLDARIDSAIRLSDADNEQKMLDELEAMPDSSDFDDDVDDITELEGKQSASDDADSTDDLTDELDDLEGSSSSGTCGGPFDQCGGNAWTGSTCCKAGCACVVQSKFYSGCEPPNGLKHCDTEESDDVILNLMQQAKKTQEKALEEAEHMVAKTKQALNAYEDAAKAQDAYADDVKDLVDTSKESQSANHAGNAKTWVTGTLKTAKAMKELKAAARHARGVGQQSKQVDQDRVDASHKAYEYMDRNDKLRMRVAAWTPKSSEDTDDLLGDDVDDLLA